MRTTMIRGLAAVLTGMAAVALMSAAPPDGDYLTHTVGRGETVSLICIKYYGRYTPELAAALKRANPGVANLNMVKPGQKLRLRRPIKAQEAPAAPVTAEEKALYEYQVKANQGVVTLVEGKARLKRPGKAAAALAANTILAPGDTVETGPDGRVEIIVNRESVVRLSANSRAAISAMRDSEKDAGKTTVELSLGTLWTKVRSAKDRLCRFELELPTAIAGVHGTVYQTTVAADQSAEVKVYDGEVSVAGKPRAAGGTAMEPGEVPGPDEVPGPHEVSMEEWVRIVRAMQRITIDKSGKPSDPAGFQRKTNDTWEQFNEERDRQVAGIVTEL